MSLTLAQVRTWQADALAGVADGVTARRRMLLGCLDDLAAASPPSSWTGRAAAAATTAQRELESALEQMVQELSGVITALDAAADVITAVLGELSDTLDYATGSGCRVDLVTGMVHPDTDAAPVQRVADRLTQVLSNAAEADAALARALHTAAAALGTSGPDAGDPQVAAPPAGADERDVARWWREMDPAAQQHVLAEHPEWVGNLDGIPGWARDEANRTLLPRYRSELAASYDRLLDLALASPANPAFFIEAARVQKMLDGLDSIDSVLARGGRQLLTLDITGDHELRAAVAVGDVDTADSVGVFTPGFTSSVRDSLAGYDSSMASLAETAATESLRQGNVNTVATVTWLGYEAPQADLGLLLPSRSVVSAGPAQAGAEDLASFMRGVQASREAPAHLVPMAHSYGSVVTGYALQEATGADAAVMFGSPGVGTSDVGDLEMPEGSTYMIEARRDVVADTGWFGRDPSHMDGVTGLSALEEEIGGTTYSESVGHNAYLAEGSTSQYNLAQILAGQPEHAVQHHGRGIGDWFSRPLW
ncbi:alpha/beta hydrolase [Pseudactinotalea sp. Z1732]|uniref:alpha/beta hydrolase n=1 Tax=Micrococcales TaxID=85006 RepID=UPI003C79EF73